MSKYSRNTPGPFARALLACQMAYPAQRTSQIIVNALGGDPFYSPYTFRIWWD